MPHPEQHYRWSWELRAAPAALWPLVSNTDRFNRDCGYPAVSVVPAAQLPPHVRRLRTRVAGVAIEWDELAFEWIVPRRFGVERRYRRGPVAKMVVDCELAPRRDGGTSLVYAMRITPAGWLGRIVLPLSIGFDARRKMSRVFRAYDELASRQTRYAAIRAGGTLARGGAERLGRIVDTLVTEHRQRASLVAKLEALLGSGDEQVLARIRAYAMADAWREPRRETLHLFLHATRAGLLDFSWDVVCPHCRGAKPGAAHLGALNEQAHCDSCGIDFTANFDQTVELTFTPNAAIRPVARQRYCVGGPQVTPHIVAQQLLQPRDECHLRLDAASGGYRVRSPSAAVQTAFRVADDGPPALTISLAEPENGLAAVAPGGDLVLVNRSAEPRLGIVEHLAWTDQATTAAEVTALQLFRDLFSREVLRAGERIGVGSMTVVFTDLKDSTQMYQRIGDAPAFGRVLTHFDVLRTAVEREGGCIVKTMGDAIMAVFTRPACAVRAMVEAQQWLANPAVLPGAGDSGNGREPLRLKCGMHAGPCLAINQNDRLDYFGTTVNLAARLCGQSRGTDIVLSEVVATDPEVSVAIGPGAVGAPETVRLKGFDENTFTIRRLSSGAVSWHCRDEPVSGRGDGPDTAQPVRRAGV